LDSNCFIITPAPPKRCGDLVCSQFPNIITSFPWTEGFEGPSWVAGTGTGTPPSLTHRGTIPFADRWSVSPAATSGTGWSVRQGPSPNQTSGPENAHSGQKYLYFENSFPAPPGNSQLITPCIDLRNVNGCSALEFYYHKFGNGMGNLRIDIDTGDGTALNNQLWINGVYEIPGSTNNSKTSPWIKAFVSLEKYQGKIIRIRFTGFKGPNDNGDMAIDAIRVYQPGALNVALVSVQAPADGFCEYTGNENIRIRVRNEGCSDLTNLQFRFRENPAVAWTNFTFPFTVTSGMDTLYTLPSPAQANLAAFNTYNMDFQLVLPGDSDTLNNKLSLVVNHNPAIPSLPFLETFNGPNTTAGNGTTNTGTYTGTNLFFNAPLIGPIPAGYNSYGLMVENKFTNTGNTGPARGHGRTGNYVYSEMGFGGFPASAVVFTRCVDLTSTTQPILEFRYHNYGNPANLPPTTIPELGSINVQVKIEGSNTWTNLGPIISPPPSLTNSWENWPLARRDLTPYIGTTIQLRIVVSKTSAAANVSDIGLDNIFIFDRATADAGVDNIGAPNFSSTTGAFSFSLFNHGTQALTSVPYEVTITPLCGPNANIPSVSNFTYNTSIPAGGSATVSGTVSNPIPRGFFNFKVKTKLVGDPFSFNDSLERKVIGQRSDTIPLFYNFDDCGNTPYTSSSAYPFVSVPITTATNSILFELGTPAKSSINAAFSPPNAWITDLTDNTQRGKTEILMMPELYGFDTVERVFLRFRHNLKIGTGSAARVEILVGNNWAPLGNASTFGSSATTINNWYSHPTFGTPNATVFGTNEPAWTGSTGGWVMSSFPLQEFNYSTTPRQIRFIMKTSPTDNPDNGWAIDNV
jgi:hypothetical protein